MFAGSGSEDNCHRLKSPAATLVSGSTNTLALSAIAGRVEANSTTTNLIPLSSPTSLTVPAQLLCRSGAATSTTRFSSDAGSPVIAYFHCLESAGCAEIVQDAVSNGSERETT